MLLLPYPAKKFSVEDKSVGIFRVCSEVRIIVGYDFLAFLVSSKSFVWGDLSGDSKKRACLSRMRLRAKLDRGDLILGRLRIGLGERSTEKNDGCPKA